MKATTIGIEVELAIYHLTRPVVCSFIPWTKDEPLDIDGTLFHKDASMFEIAMRPCSNGTELDTAYDEAINEVRKLVPSGTDIRLEPAVEYSDSELASDPYASVLGCGASQNVYLGTVGMPSEYTNNIRYAGMHVNIAADEDMSPVQVLALDATLGLKSVRDWEQPYADAIRTRRTMYGRAGEYRIKPFGTEYRTLPSSSWAATSGNEIFSLVNQALNLDAQSLIPMANDIQQAIDMCDADAAGGGQSEVGINDIEWTGLDACRCIRISPSRLLFLGPAGLRTYKKTPCSYNMIGIGYSVVSGSYRITLQGPNMPHGSISNSSLVKYMSPPEYGTFYR